MVIILPTKHTKNSKEKNANFVCYNKIVIEMNPIQVLVTGKRYERNLHTRF